MRKLPEVISDIFTYHGAVMEEKGEENMNFLAPESLSKTLEIPEYGNLNFGSTASCEESIQASYDSELLKTMGKLFLQKGKISTAEYPPCKLNIKKFSNKVIEKIAFSNATFRFNGSEKRIVKYLLFYFKYTALSDEKKEGMFPILVNVMNSSVTFPKNSVGRIWDELKAPRTKPERLENNEVAFLAASSVASVITKEILGDFIKSLERRLNLDIRKGHEYYEILKEETKNAIGKKVSIDINYAENKKTSKGHNKSIEEIIKDAEKKPEKYADIKKMVDKLDAVNIEQKWKIKDLIAKYSLNIEVEPVSVIHIETEAVVFQIDIKRRRAARQFPVVYNPIMQHVDPLPCESCFYPQGAYYICDDKLHVLCGNCFKECPSCEKRYCRACYKKGCPKCKV